MKNKKEAHVQREVAEMQKMMRRISLREELLLWKIHTKLIQFQNREKYREIFKRLNTIARCRCRTGRRARAW